MTVTISGRCLCGSVRFRGNAEPRISLNCYCADCRRLSGTAHASHIVVPEAGIQIDGDLRTYTKAADSGNEITRKFCPTCGSHICATNSAMPGMVGFRASALDDLDSFAPQVTVYASRAPKWDPVDSGIPAFDEMPPHRG